MSRITPPARQAFLRAFFYASAESSKHWLSNHYKSGVPSENPIDSFA
jgi:hypothetical protein